MEVPMCITHSKLNTQNSIFNTLSIYMLFHIQNVQCVAVLRCLIYMSFHIQNVYRYFGYGMTYI